MVFRKLPVFLEMIKFEHTLFALPFAYIGALVTNKQIPTGHDLLWITVAMVGARTAAMSLNRIIDRHIDAQNPRTAERALPRGLLSVTEVWIYTIFSFLLLLLAAANLSPLAVKLFPLVVAILVGYSYTKRFTWACHLWLGAALGFAPLGSWVAITNRLDLAPVLLAGGVLFWVAGFDVIYACLDYEFDRQNRIYSIPAQFGIRRALKISTFFHIISPALFITAGMVLKLGMLYYIGIGVAVALLVYQHMLVTPVNLARINIAFFNLNAALSVTMLVFTLADILIR